MNTYTDEQLKQALAKMLPGKLYFRSGDASHISRFEWIDETRPELLGIILATELLQLCWEVEETLTDDVMGEYNDLMWELMSKGTTKKLPVHATWKQRIPALAAVKGITI